MTRRPAMRFDDIWLEFAAKMSGEYGQYGFLRERQSEHPVEYRELLSRLDGWIRDHINEIRPVSRLVPARAVLRGHGSIEAKGREKEATKLARMLPQLREHLDQHPEDATSKGAIRIAAKFGIGIVTVRRWLKEQPEWHKETIGRPPRKADGS